MSEFANEAGIWAARITGAVAGAGVSLVYLLPKSKREAASRFITGVSCGMIFGGPIGLWIVQQLDIAGALSGREIMVYSPHIAGVTHARLSRAASRHA